VLSREEWQQGKPFKLDLNSSDEENEWCIGKCVPIMIIFVDRRACPTTELIEEMQPALQACDRPLGRQDDRIEPEVRTGRLVAHSKSRDRFGLYSELTEVNPDRPNTDKKIMTCAKFGAFTEDRQTVTTVERNVE
jgi:hypothetical protein